MCCRLVVAGASFFVANSSAISAMAVGSLCVEPACKPGLIQVSLRIPTAGPPWESVGRKKTRWGRLIRVRGSGSPYRGQGQAALSALRTRTIERMCGHGQGGNVMPEERCQWRAKARRRPPRGAPLALCYNPVCLSENLIPGPSSSTQPCMRGSGPKTSSAVRSPLAWYTS